MRVVFDAFWYVDGPPSQRHVLREIVATWSDLFPADELILVVRRRTSSAAIESAPDGVRVRSSRLYPHALLATLSVGRVARAEGATGVLSHNFAPRFRAGVSAIFLHDVLFVDHPEWFTRFERVYFSFMPRLIKRADIVFTSSVTEVDRIARVTRAPAIAPVGIGLSEELIGVASDDGVGRRLALAQHSFLLAVGRLNVRKNLGRTIAGLLGSGSISKQRPLVVVGSGDGKGEVLSAAAEAAVEEGTLIFAGHVTDAELRWLYENAAAAIFASLGEGFGMPPVEAAYFGCPLVVSDLPVFRETVGEWATFVDPMSPEDIARGVVEVLARARPHRDSVHWLEKYNWRDTVQALRARMITEWEARR